VSVIRNVELVMWSTRGEPPLIVEVREALASHGFLPERAEDLPASTVFRRAVKLKEVAKQSRVTVWDDGLTHAQLDNLVLSGDRIRREFVESWRLNEDGSVQGSSLDMHHCRTHYLWSDVTVTLKRILDKDSLGAYTPRKAGGVYFVPVRSADFLDRLESVCRSIGLLFLRYQIPDTGAQRDEVADAVFLNLSSDIDGHAAALAAYTVERTPAGIVRNRDDSVVATVALIGRLSEHLGGRAGTLTDRCAELRRQCEELIGKIEAYRPQPAGRRIVTTPAATAPAPVSSPAATVVPAELFS